MVPFLGQGRVPIFSGEGTGPRLPVASRALLRSQSGPLSIATVPSAPYSRMDAQLHRVQLLRRLRLPPLPPSRSWCAMHSMPLATTVQWWRGLGVARFRGGDFAVSRVQKGWSGFLHCPSAAHSHHRDNQCDWRSWLKGCHCFAVHNWQCTRHWCHGCVVMGQSTLAVRMSVLQASRRRKEGTHHTSRKHQTCGFWGGVGEVGVRWPV